MVPTFVKPDRPDLQPIELLHRGAEHWIPCYQANPDRGLEVLFALSAKELKTSFESKASKLNVDAFFAINGFWQPPGRVSRLKKHLQYINAVHVDIDCHRLDMTQGKVIAELIDRQDAGLIPPVSMIANSGRGVWCFWLVCDRFCESKGQRATRVAIQLAEKINRELCKRLAPLGADAQSKDLCRITRVPGSINGKCGYRTEYWIQTNQSGRVDSYRLDELVERLGLVLPAHQLNTVDSQRSKSAAHVKAGQSGYRSRWLLELERLETLLKIRGTFREGTRGASVWIYLVILRRVQMLLGKTDSDIRGSMELLWLALEQPGGKRDRRGRKGSTSRDFSRGQFETARARPNTQAQPSHQYISESLRITRHESELTGWPEWGSVLELAPKEKWKREERQRWLRKRLFDDDGRQKKGLPSLRTLTEWLEFTDERLACSFSTVKRDLDAIGVRNPRRLSNKK